MSEDTQQSESAAEEEPFDLDEFIVFLEESRLPEHLRHKTVLQRFIRWFRHCTATSRA